VDCARDTKWAGGLVDAQENRKKDFGASRGGKLFDGLGWLLLACMVLVGQIGVEYLLL